MIQRFVPDIVSVCLIAMIAVLLTDRPNINLNPLPQAISRGGTQEKASVVRKEQKGIVSVAVLDEALKKRNIFAGNGSYATVGPEIVLPQLPEKRYVLIGILAGKEPQAIFRDEGGAVTALTKGKKLGNGFTIMGIGNVSVKIKNEKETRELKIFNVQYKPPIR